MSNKEPLVLTGLTSKYHLPCVIPNVLLVLLHDALVEATLKFPSEKVIPPF